MGRSITVIYDALALEKSEQSSLSDLAPDIDTAQSLLSDLDSPSRVAYWRLDLWVVATAIFVHEKLWDLFRAEVDAVVAAGHIGTAPWYVKMALAFQYGYELSFNSVTGVYGYATIDTAAQIVQRASITEASSLVIMKVAKVVSGVVTPLDTDEKNAFLAYMDDVQMAGVMVNVVSDNPDNLRIVYTIYYDPQVLAPTGALLSNASVFPVEDAINAFITNLPFNGRLVLASLDDAVQAAAGVRIPVRTQAKAAYGFFILADINVWYTAHAGYMAIDAGSPLSATLTYVPYVD